MWAGGPGLLGRRGLRAVCWVSKPLSRGEAGAEQGCEGAWQGERAHPELGWWVQLESGAAQGSGVEGEVEGRH